MDLDLFGPVVSSWDSVVLICSLLHLGWYLGSDLEWKPDVNSDEDINPTKAHIKAVIEHKEIKFKNKVTIRYIKKENEI